MSGGIEIAVEGIGIWGPGLTGWSASRDALRGTAEVDDTPTAKPAPPLLPVAERRRAPDTVLFAAQAAAEACAMSGRDPASLPCIFASMQGDVAITDTMCATLAQAPLELSPIKFHNSVHNAAVGYWTIATGCHAASTAVSAWTDSAGAGLLEAAVQALDGDCAVLLVIYDSMSVGPLRGPVPHDIGFASAFVLAPPARSKATLQLRLQTAPAQAATTARNAWAQAMLQRNASARVLPLLEAIAMDAPGELRIGAGSQQSLILQVRP
ncbi:MAG: beta-ketoacyl synthase chain length factor [Tahibacter sp.]